MPHILSVSVSFCPSNKQPQDHPGSHPSPTHVFLTHRWEVGRGSADPTGAEASRAAKSGASGGVRGQHLCQRRMVGPLQTPLDKANQSSGVGECVWALEGWRAGVGHRRPVAIRETIQSVHCGERNSKGLGGLLSSHRQGRQTHHVSRYLVVGAMVPEILLRTLLWTGNTLLSGMSLMCH